MRKLGKILVFFAFLGLVVFVSCKSLKAEEIEQIEPEIANVEEDEELTQDDVIALIKQKFENSELGLQIINWLIDSGFMVALVGVVIKYNKYKNKSVGELADIAYNKAKEVITQKLQENTKVLGDVKNALEKVNKANETLMKALVLMQDTTSKGKIAVLDFLSQNNEVEVKEIKQEIIEEEKVKEEIVNKVNEPYENIF